MRLECVRVQIDETKNDPQKCSTPHGTQSLKLAHRMYYPSILDYYFYDQPQYSATTADRLLGPPMLDAYAHNRIYRD